MCCRGRVQVCCSSPSICYRSELNPGQDHLSGSYPGPWPSPPVRLLLPVIKCDHRPSVKLFVSFHSNCCLKFKFLNLCPLAILLFHFNSHHLTCPAFTVLQVQSLCCCSPTVSTSARFCRIAPSIPCCSTIWRTPSPWTSTTAASWFSGRTWRWTASWRQTWMAPMWRRLSPPVWRAQVGTAARVQILGVWLIHHVCNHLCCFLFIFSLYCFHSLHPSPCSWGQRY